LDQVTVSEVEFSPPLVLSFMSAEPVWASTLCARPYSHNWYIMYAAFIYSYKAKYLGYSARYTTLKSAIHSCQYYIPNFLAERSSIDSLYE